MLKINSRNIKYMLTIIFTLISSIFVYNVIEKDKVIYSSYAINKNDSQIIINLQRSGGMINLLPINYTLDSNLLSDNEEIKLKELIENSNFYNLKNESLLSKKGADYYVYKIMIERNGTSKNINTTSFSMPKELKDLISFVIDYYKNNNISQ
jgi:hypothetical protein